MHIQWVVEKQRNKQINTNVQRKRINNQFRNPYLLDKY